MSAALSTDDPWAVAAHEPAQPPPGPTPPDDGQMWAHAAQGVALHVMQSAEAVRQIGDTAIEHVRAIAGHAAQAADQAANAAGQAIDAARHASSTVEEMRQIAATNREMVDAIRTMGDALKGVIEELRAPRRMTVTKRDADGAVAEAISEVRR